MGHWSLGQQHNGVSYCLHCGFPLDGGTICHNSSCPGKPRRVAPRGPSRRERQEAERQAARRAAEAKALKERRAREAARKAAKARDIQQRAAKRELQKEQVRAAKAAAANARVTTDRARREAEKQNRAAAISAGRRKADSQQTLRTPRHQPKPDHILSDSSKKKDAFGPWAYKFGALAAIAAGIYAYAQGWNGGAISSMAVFGLFAGMAVLPVLRFAAMLVLVVLMIAAAFGAVALTIHLAA